MELRCLFCNADESVLGTNLVLNKYNVKYYRCNQCGFIHTETPYWLAEAYYKAIADEDTGYVRRNLRFAQFSQQLIQRYYSLTGNYLDYGSGYGLYVRLMRDVGLKFFGYDEYCANILAKEYQLEYKAVQSDSHYEMLTCFEVFEHFIFPVQEIEKLMQMSNDILFSTELVPNPPPHFSEWHYYSGSTGQHISIYSLETLTVLAQRSKKCLYSDTRWLHLLTDKTDLDIPLRRII